MYKYALSLTLLFLSLRGDAQSNPIPFDKLSNLNWEDLKSYTDSVKNVVDPEPFSQLLFDILQYGEDHGNVDMQLVAYLHLGGYYWEHSKYAVASNFFEKGLSIAIEENKLKVQATFLVNYSGLLSHVDKSDEALSNLLRANKIYGDMDERHSADVQFHLANFYYNIKQYDQAINYGLLSASKYQALTFDSLSKTRRDHYMNVVNTIGIAYGQLAQYDSGIFYLEKARKIAALNKNEFWVNLINGNLGNLYQKTSDYDKALNLLQTDFNTSKFYKQWESAAGASLSIAQVYMKLQDAQKAEAYIDSANVIIGENNLKALRPKYYQQKATYHELIGNYEQALFWHKEYVTKKDSFQNIANDAEIARIKMAYDIDNKMLKIDLLTQNNELQKKDLKKKNIIIGISVLLLLLIIGMSIYMYRNLGIKNRDNLLLAQQKEKIEAQNEELEIQSEALAERNRTIQSINENLEFEIDKRTKSLKQINKELDTFLYRASHDIRQPISTILGLENLARQTSKDVNLHVILEKLNNTAQGMDQMLAKLQMLYRLNHEKAIDEQFDLKITFKEILEPYQKEIGKKGIRIENQLENMAVFTNKDYLCIIVRNIIENAIYFSDPAKTPIITIYKTSLANRKVINIEDNGYGIPPPFIDLIFNAFFKGDVHSRGNGLGLYLAKKSADILGMLITVRSEITKGSVFSVHLPN